MESKFFERKDTYILIPAYKPDHLMIELLTNLKREGFDIVVVNDGSGEEYNSVFEEAKQYAYIINQTPNRGKGAALRLGFSYVNLHQEDHKYVITCDADGQHAIKDIIAVNDKLHETDNVVLGSRKFDKSVPKRSRNGNFMSRLCRTLLTKEYVPDDQCGLRGFPLKDIFNIITLPGNHYEYEMNVICNLQIKRLKFEQVPIETIYLNNNSSSHFKPSLDTFRIQRTIWINAILPLVCVLLSIVMMAIFSTLLAEPHYNQYIWLGASYLFYFYLLMGFTALFWPTRKMARRVLVEGIYFTIKAALVFGIVALFIELTPLYAWAAYIIALLFTFLLNFPLAYLWWKFRINRKIKKS